MRRPSMLALAASAVGIGFHGCDAKRLGITSALGAKARNATTEKAPMPQQPTLRIFSATYNGGNKEYEQSDHTQPLFSSMLRGHEHSDIIMVGLQEFKDPEDEMHHMVRERLLWQDLTRKRTEEGVAAVASAMRPTDAAVAAQAQLLQDLSQWRDAIATRMELFLQEYGAESTGFHVRVASNSPILKLEEQAMMIDGSRDEFLRHRTKYMGSKHIALKDRLRAMQDAAEEMLSDLNLDKVRKILADRIEPLETWAASASRRVRDVRGTFPFLGQQADHAWYETLADVFKLENLREFLADAHDHIISKFRLQVAEYQRGIELAVDDAESSLVNKMLRLFEAQAEEGKGKDKFGTNSAEDVSQPMAPEAAALFRTGAERSIRAAVRQEAAIQQANLQKAFEKMKKGVKDLQAVFKVPGLAIEPAQVEVQGSLQRFFSGRSCHMWPVKHFDLMTYVYVNPWSDWKVQQVEYSSFACKNKGSVLSKGCNLDQCEGIKECGKGVNLMVFDVTHRHQSSRIRLCTLNTHMSYGGDARTRMNNIIKALEETQRAKCTATVFVGDFNSRMHCESQEGSREKLPPYERVHPHTGTKPDLMWATHCQGDAECSLRDSAHYIQDEMTQLLNSSMLRCFEEQQKSLFGGGGGWEMVTSWNILKQWGMMEAFQGPPPFAPTYTVKPMHEAMKKKKGHGKSWVKCMAGEEWCYINKDADGKHNPAWTDRILYRPSPSADVATTAYERRLAPTWVGSDHIPVVAQFDVTPLE